MRNYVINDPVIRGFADYGRDEGRTEGRALAKLFYDRTQALKPYLRGSIPRTFLDWIMMEASENDMISLESAIEPGLTFGELIARSGVRWSENRDHTYG